MAYALSYSQKWDTCAGESIIKGINGFCSTKYGEELVYDPQNPKEYNRDGVICSLSPEIMKIAAKTCREHKPE